MPFFAMILAALSLGALFFDASTLLLWPTVAILAFGLLYGLFAGMGRGKPAVALALVGAIALFGGWMAPGLAFLAGGTGAAWGRPQSRGLGLSAPLLLVGAVGFGATLAPDRVFDPFIAAGMASVGLVVLPLIRVGLPVAALVGAGVGFAWGLVGFGLGGMVAGGVVAGIAVCARRVPARALSTGAGLLLGGGFGAIMMHLAGPEAAYAAHPFALPINPALVVLLSIFALVPLFMRGSLDHSHALAVLVAMLAASFWAPDSAGAGLAITAMVGAGLCAPQRPSLFVRHQPAPAFASSPLFPWIRRTIKGYTVRKAASTPAGADAAVMVVHKR